MQSTEYHFQHHPPDLRQYEQGQISKKPPTKFRTRFPQFLANLTCNLLVLDLCMSYGFTTVVIAALLDVPDAEFPLDNTAASWLGSLAYICQPIGSVMSGMIVEYFGRKWSMIIVNLPFLVGWIIYSVSNSVAMLYVANVILGVGIGFMEAPIMTYIAETCQPEIRQILSTSISISIQLSFFIVYLLGTLTGWRTTAAISAGLPILTALYVTQMPETPIYLISRGKIKEAENALRWLRGWVAPEYVRKEFNELIKYNDASSKKITMVQLATVESSQGKIPEGETLTEENTQETAYSDDNEGHGSHCSMQLLREMIKPPTLRPLLLVLPYFLLYQFGCMAGMRAYLVHVFRELGLEDMSEWTAVGSAVIGMIGALFLITTVNWLGKRLISFISFTGNCIACILLAVYCFVVLRPGGAPESAVTWVPLTLIVIYSFFSSVTFAIPWALLCEVFPFRTRGIASGFSAAMCYVFLFLASKTYLDLESSLELYGVFIFFAVLNLIAVVFVYFRMPPMEGKTLAEIEEYFSGQSKEFPRRSRLL